MSPTSYLTAPPRVEVDSHPTAPTSELHLQTTADLRLTEPMVPLSANLGFLWTELSLPNAIRAAAAAGFDAVECHTPYAVDRAEVRHALDETGLPLLGINTAPGDTPTTGPGLAALPGHETEARRLIDQAIDYATSLDCAHIHVMAGKAAGPDAHATYISNLTYAAEQASTASDSLRILIEPLNARDMPGYFLADLEQAAAVVAEVTDRVGSTAGSSTAGSSAGTGRAGTGAARNGAAGAIGIMFDCYHVQLTGGDLLHRFETHLPLIGHVQFAGVPHRSEPDTGEVDYTWLLPQLIAAGYQGYAGAEYHPATTTEAGLAWMRPFR